MKKIIMVFLALGLSAFGMSYAQFKKHTLKHSKILQSQGLSLQVTQEENKILLRTQNPTLDLEASHYNPNGDSSSYEYSTMATQTIRTPNYFDGLRQKANANSLLQQAYVRKGKAGFIQTLENLFTNYVYQGKLLALFKEEYALSNEVSKMVYERYKNGSENKVSYLQAKTETLTLKTQMYTTKQEMTSLYYQLLSIAGLSKKVSLEKRFIYSVSKQTNNISNITPKQQILNAKKKLLASQIQMNESIIDNYSFYGGIENEPDQSILRMGISIPLPIFNNKSEEQALARLQMQQLSLENEQLAIDIKSQKAMIKASIKEMSSQYYALKTLKKEQQTLSNLLQDGYQIAQGSLFGMMSAKNKLIQTRKALLQTQKLINTQKIELRFIQGSYND